MPRARNVPQANSRSRVSARALGAGGLFARQRALHADAAELGDHHALAEDLAAR